MEKLLYQAYLRLHREYLQWDMNESKITTFNLIEQDEDLEYNNNDIIDDKEDLESIGDSSNELF